MPLSLHVATNRGKRDAEHATTDTLPSDDGSRLLGGTMAITTVRPYFVQLSLAKMIFSGVFERFPGLKVVSTENDAGWAGYLLFAMVYNYTQKARPAERPRFKTDRIPSDFFHSNVMISFQEEALAIQTRSIIGVDNLLWGSDYPHQESTFPKSMDILDRILTGVPEDEAAKIAGGNTARVYGF